MKPRRITTMSLALAPALVLAATLSLSPCMFVAWAQPRAVSQDTRSYAVPGGPLDRVLLDVARVTGAALAFESAMTEGLISPGVSGDMDRDTALQTALKGTGLTVVERQDGWLTLAPARERWRTGVPGYMKDRDGRHGFD